MGTSLNQAADSLYLIADLEETVGRTVGVSSYTILHGIVFREIQEL